MTEAEMKAALSEAYDRGVQAGARATLGYIKVALAPFSPHQVDFFAEAARAADTLKVNGAG